MLHTSYEEKFKRSEAKREEVQREAGYLHDELMSCLVLNEKYAIELRDLHARVALLKEQLQQSAASDGNSTAGMSRRQQQLHQQQQKEQQEQQQALMLQMQKEQLESQAQRDEATDAVNARIIATLEETVQRLQVNEDRLTDQVWCCGGEGWVHSCSR